MLVSSMVAMTPVGARVGAAREFRVIAGDGTVQLPPELLDAYPPGTLLSVDHLDGQVVLEANRSPGG